MKLSNKSHASKTAKTAKKRTKNTAKKLAGLILDILDKQSAENIINIDLQGKSSVADYMIIASGRSNRHVNALADYVKRGLKENGIKNLGVEGEEQCDWVLLDAGDVIIHIFRPEVREFYALEKLWAMPKTIAEEIL